MDDDCTTLARVRQELTHDIEKWSDQNHTVKHLGNSLYNLQKKHKVLSAKVIKHLQKCFNYALAQNKEKPDDFKGALKQIVPHVFGDHQSCGTWCGYQKDPQNYRHNGLPYGRPLTGEGLRADLNSVFDLFIQNAERIAPGGSTNDVESFNNMIASKAPKRIHYSASESILNRVACAVAQKNEGATYVNKVNNEIGISPGNVMESHAKKF
ncbi:uncharacterized protein LOC128551991 [Mercenaria mercenaria]|uniref:uncharacterized protein LOC128551991 n=1 Tax=Mercenaria mercenaria TaxID=6596 RepID=UPI00234EB842|nr:uncharacterized protein LOC128551991 [Mercenaria mercenaria]